MKQSRQLLILFAVVIIASGCASNTQTEGATSSVISVNSFDATPDPVPAGQTLTLNMELENVGDSTAENVAARVFGPSFYNEEEKASRTKRFGELRSSSDDNPSIPKTKTWTIDTPGIGENREVDYTFYSKIFYDYETRGTTDFKLVSQDRYREQDYTQSDATLETTDGPIDLDIRGTTPKIFYESDGNTVESEICVVATNTGDGKAFTEGTVNDGRMYGISDENADEDTIDLTIEETAGVEFDASGEDRSGNRVEDVQLINGQEGYQCFTMRASAGENDETNLNTQITAEYNYVKETQTSVTSEGRRGSGDPEPINSGEDSNDGNWQFKEVSSLDSKYSGQTLEDKEDQLETLREDFNPEDYCTADSTGEDQLEDYCEEN